MKYVMRWNEYRICIWKRIYDFCWWFGNGVISEDIYGQEGWMDGWMDGKRSRWISPSPSQHISLKWSRWISSLLHNTLLASPHCINVISGKQIVKRSITIWSLKFRICQIWLFTYWLGLVEQYNLYIWKEISCSFFVSCFCPFWEHLSFHIVIFCTKLAAMRSFYPTISISPIEQCCRMCFANPKPCQRHLRMS